MWNKRLEQMEHARKLAITEGPSRRVPSPTSGIKPIINPPRKLKKDRGEAEGSGPTTEHRSSRFSARSSMVSVAYLTDFERANNTLYNDWAFIEEQARSDLAANLWPPPSLPLREYSIKPPGFQFPEQPLTRSSHVEDETQHECLGS